MENGKEVFARFYRVFLIGLPVLALFLLGGVLFFAPYVTFNEEFLEGFKIIGIITFSYVFHGIYYFNAMGMLFEKKTLVIMYIIMSCGVTNFILNVLLVPNLGMLGAAIASLASYIQMFFLGRHYSQRYYAIQRDTIFEFSQIGLISITVALITYLLYSIGNIQLAGMIIFGGGIFYFILNVGLGNVSLGELIAMKKRIFR